MHCVDLGESFETNVYLQNLASIQPRTSPDTGYQLYPYPLFSAQSTALGPPTVVRAQELPVLHLPGWAPCRQEPTTATTVLLITSLQPHQGLFRKLDELLATSVRVCVILVMN